MANKILTFGNSGIDFLNTTLSSELSSTANQELYTDVSMQAGLNGRCYSKKSGCAAWKVDKSINVKAIFNSLRNIFTWVPGERILLPEFGSRLRMLLYEGITPQTEEAIAAEIRGCVSEWEPRVSIVEIRNVSTIDDTEDNTIHLEVVFVIPSLSDEQFTYSFSYNMQE